MSAERTVTSSGGQVTAADMSYIFNEVDDGARVTLTFHLWSGAQVTYYITRSSSTAVTGSTR